jgi:hypothetical protein
VLFPGVDDGCQTGVDGCVAACRMGDDNLLRAEFRQRNSSGRDGDGVQVKRCVL